MLVLNLAALLVDVLAAWSVFEMVATMAVPMADKRVELKEVSQEFEKVE